MTKRNLEILSLCGLGLGLMTWVPGLRGQGQDAAEAYRKMALQQQRNVQLHLSAALGGLAESVTQQGGAAIEFRELKEALPAAVGELRRVNWAGERSGSTGFQVSTAEATYRGSDGRQVKISLRDLGGLPDVGAAVAKAWGNAAYERETDEGYERTILIQGFRAREQYNRVEQSGSIILMAGKRVMVEVRGLRVPISLLKGAVEALEPKELAGLSPKGALGS